MAEGDRCRPVVPKYTRVGAVVVALIIIWSGRCRTDIFAQGLHRLQKYAVENED